MSLTTEQIELRRTGVGASEAAAACGLSKYQQTVELFLRKTGQVEDEEQSRDLLFGNFMEAGGVRYWEALRETPVEYPMQTVRHPQYPFMLSTPDGRIGPKRGLEFKTMDFFRFKMVERDGIANVIPEYVLQCQQQMACMDWDTVVIAIMVGKDLHDIEVERNDRLISLIAEREAIFWDHVQRGVAPNVDFSQEGALRAVQALHPDVKTGDVVQLDEETSVLWEAYSNAGKEIGELNKKRDGWKAAVLAKIGDNYAGLLANGQKMIRRKLIERKGHYVEPCEYIDARLVNYDGSRTVDPLSILTAQSEAELPAAASEDQDDTVRRIDFRLRQAGFLVVDTSPSGSRYYVHKSEPLRVRMSDHNPSPGTSEWMDRQGIVREIRTDDGRAEAMDQLAVVLEELESATLAAN